MPEARPVALFDDTHGQRNWCQTGFPSRELASNCSALAEMLRGMGYDCRSIRPRLLLDCLFHARLLCSAIFMSKVVNLTGRCEN